MAANPQLPDRLRGFVRRMTMRCRANEPLVASAPSVPLSGSCSLVLRGPARRLGCQARAPRPTHRIALRFIPATVPI